jgi:hypothetical protein
VTPATDATLLTLIVAFSAVSNVGKYVHAGAIAAHRCCKRALFVASAAVISVSHGADTLVAALNLALLAYQPENRLKETQDYRQHQQECFVLHFCV